MRAYTLLGEMWLDECSDQEASPLQGDYAGSAGDEIQWGKYDVIVSIVVVTDVL